MKTIKVIHAEWQGPVYYNEHEFERIFQIKYLSQLTFADYTIERWIRARCSRAIKSDCITEIAKWLGHLHSKQIEEGEAPDVSLRWINEEIGYGLFTDATIKKWNFVGQYTGVLRRRNRFFANLNDYCFMYPSTWKSFKALTIDAKFAGNHTRFINHSDIPNVESISIVHQGLFKIIFRALVDIPAHTELRYNYGNPYWNRKKKVIY